MRRDQYLRASHDGAAEATFFEQKNNNKKMTGNKEDGKFLGKKQESLDPSDEKKREKK